MATKTICTSALDYAKRVYGKVNSLGKSWKCPCGSGYCKLTANQLLKEGLRPETAVGYYRIQVTQVTGVSKPAIVPKPVKRIVPKPVKRLEAREFSTPQLLIVDNETMNLVNSVKYPLDFSYPSKFLLQGVMTVHKVLLLFKELGYDPVLATPKSIMDVGLASDIAIKWKGGWRLMQVKSSLQYAEVHFEKKGRGFQLHPKISALLPGIDPRRHWECPECLIIVNGRLVCLNANGKGVFMPPALRADDYVEKYNW